MLSDEEWGEAAAAVMDWIGFARHDDESGVRWAAVRHAPDHIRLTRVSAQRFRPSVLDVIRLSNGT
jgi:hypothetical protein